MQVKRCLAYYLTSSSNNPENPQITENPDADKEVVQILASVMRERNVKIYLIVTFNTVVGEGVCIVLLSALCTRLGCCFT
jgi:hypothetical protein